MISYLGTSIDLGYILQFPPSFTRIYTCARPALYIYLEDMVLNCKACSPNEVPHKGFPRHPVEDCRIAVS